MDINTTGALQSMARGVRQVVASEVGAQAKRLKASGSVQSSMSEFINASSHYFIVGFDTIHDSDTWTLG